MKKHPRVVNHLPSDTAPDPKGIITRGECDIDDAILYINPKQGDKQKLITAVHEALHYIFPKHTEQKVERDSILIGTVVWKLGYRIKNNENIKRNIRARIDSANKGRKLNRKDKKNISP